MTRPKRRVLFGLLIVPLITALLVSPGNRVYGQGGIPPIPHAFYGAVSFSGGASPAPVGTVVTAWVSSVQMGSIAVAVDGYYGGAASGQPKLIVQGMIADGATIEFRINGNAATQTAAFQSGAVSQLDLTTAAGPPAQVPTPTPVPTSPPPSGSSPPPPPPQATQAPPALADQISQQQPADAARTLEAASAQQAASALAGVDTGKAATIVQNMDPAKAASALAAAPPATAGAIMDRTSTDALVQIIPKMDEQALVKSLSVVSPSKLHEIPPATLLSAMPGVSPEKLVASNAPQPSPTASLPVTVSSSDSSATYASSTPSGGWGKLAGTPYPLKSILVKTRVALSNVRTMLDVYSSRPAGVSRDLPADQVAKNYFQVRLEGIAPSDIIVGYISFKVDKSWLASTGVQKWSLALSRFDDTAGAWLALPTTIDSEDSEYVYLSAPVARFSYFAISGSVAVPAAQFKATRIEISPSGTEPGKPVTITASITNVSSVDGSFAAALWLDKTVDQVQTVAVKAGATASIVFQASAGAPGAHEVRVDRQVAGFTVFPTVAEAFQSISGKFTAVWAFDAQTQSWKVFDGAVPAWVNDLRYIEKAKGYWLSVSADSVLTYGGNAYQLTKGWNLIGWLG